MFIPTKHYHAHNNLKNSGSTEQFNIINGTNAASTNSVLETNLVGTEDWDHEIYLYNGTNKSNKQFIQMSKNDEYWTNENLIKTNLINFPFSKLGHFEKHKISGYQKNIDLYANVNNISNNKIGLVY